jgi:hypothetical protein
VDFSVDVSHQLLCLRNIIVYLKLSIRLHDRCLCLSVTAVELRKRCLKRKFRCWLCYRGKRVERNVAGDIRSMGGMMEFRLWICVINKLLGWRAWSFNISNNKNANTQDYDDLELLLLQLLVTTLFNIIFPVSLPTCKSLIATGFPWIYFFNNFLFTYPCPLLQHSWFSSL